MNDNDVIKALECCIRNEYCFMCEECPLKTRPQCEEVLYRETVDLINSQKAEIKQKDTEIDILIRKKETLKDELAEKQAEIEELQKYKHDYYVLQSITRKKSFGLAQNVTS